MSKLIITRRSKTWSDECHREDGHFDPIVLTLEEAIEACKAEGNRFTEITLHKNDEKHTKIAHFEYTDGKLIEFSNLLTDELKKTKVKFWCCVGGWGRMDFNVIQVSNDSEELVGYLSIEELEVGYKTSKISP